MTSTEALELWYAALHSESPFGIVVETDGLERLRAKMYQARASCDDPSLENLVITTSPINPNQLWIVKQDAQDR